MFLARFHNPALTSVLYAATRTGISTACPQRILPVQRRSSGLVLFPAQAIHWGLF